MPRTRYQGSKRKLLPWIWENIKHLDFHSVLDAFGGSACVSHFLKAKGKAVTYNDFLVSNYLTGLALVENADQQLSPEAIDAVLAEHPSRCYDDFIERTFHQTYFLDDENRWLDRLCRNIPAIKNPYQRAIAYYGLFQAAIAKRPYNLFHRKNLYMRTARVKRTFGNKTTWDRSFEDHFRSYVTAANQAVFASDQPCQACCTDAGRVPADFDLVYIDPPYISAKGVGVDYHGFYHFLEGMADYPAWPEKIDYQSKHRRLLPRPNPWTNRHQVLEAFRRLLRRHADSTLVISYRSDGIPSPAQLLELLRQVKSNVTLVEYGHYKYVLSTNAASKEILLIAAD